MMTAAETSCNKYIEGIEKLESENPVGKCSIKKRFYNKYIKRSLVWAIFLLSFTKTSFSQEFDLIVTAKNDSLACHIDSVAGDKIYFEMRYKRKWVHTYFNISDVIDYKQTALDINDISFIRGTSYFINQESRLINHINRNIIHGTGSYLLYIYTLSLNYERIIYVSESGGRTWSFRTAYGVINNSGKMLLGSFNNLRGKGKNKLELDIGAAYIDEPHNYGPHFVTIVLSAGYRRQSPEGRFVFRAGAGTPEGIYLSFGYSF